MAPRTYKVEIPHHADYKQWKGKDHTRYKLTGLILDLSLPCNLFRIFCSHIVVWENGTVTGLFNSRYNIFNV